MKLPPYVLFTAGIFASLNGQARAQGTSDSLAIPALRSVLATDGLAASVSPSLTTLFSTSFTPTATCRGLLQLATDSRFSTDTSIYEIDLRALSADVSVRLWRSGSEMRSVDLLTTDGAATISQSTRSYDKANKKAKFSSYNRARIYVVSDNLAGAERLRNAWSRAIRSCGGAGLTAAAQAQRDSANTANASYLAQMTGTDSVGVLVKGLCRDAVRALLLAPSTAVFSDETAAGLPGSTERMVLGKVEATNSLGGRRQQTYTCSYQKYGESWKASKPALIFP
jgi:hypothetical protein